MNFAIGTWEIHLQSIEERSYILQLLSKHCSYIDTAIDYNNDYLIPNNIPIISKISSYHEPEYEFFVSNHIKCLHRDKIDIMLIHSSRGNWKNLAKKIVNDTRFKEVGVSNFNVDEIKEFIQLTGYKPKYNEIEINPYYTDIDTINYCKENGIKIISYGVFGGKYNAMTNIADFSLPYLLAYANQYADIIIVKPESYRQVNELVDVIENFDFDSETFNFNLRLTNDTENNKAIVPMRYFAKDVVKKYNGIPTYNNACGKNILDSVKFELEEVNIPLSFEMLGDYQVYIRYLFRQNYDTTNIYDYDFLIGDDGNYYIALLYDDKDRITKINKFNKAHVYKVIKKGN